MPKRLPRPHGGGKRGGDGLTDRQRAFVRERREDLTSPMHEIMRRAGFIGTPQELGMRANVLMRTPKVSAAVYAPNPKAEAEISDEEGLKKEMRRRLLSITRGNASDADKIKAIDKLLSTIPGGYVPVQVDMKGHMTMEALVRAMGGAPDGQVDQYAQAVGLPPHKEDA